MQRCATHLHPHGLPNSIGEAWHTALRRASNSYGRTSSVWEPPAQWSCTAPSSFWEAAGLATPWRGHPCSSTRGAAYAACNLRHAARGQDHIRGTSWR